MTTFLDSLMPARGWLLFAALVGELAIVTALTIACFALHRRVRALSIVVQTWIDPSKGDVR